MAEDEVQEGEDGEAGAAGAKGGGKKKLILIVAVVVLLLGGGVGAAYFLGFLDPVLEMAGLAPVQEEMTEEQAVDPTPVFVDLPEMVVNLNTTGRKTTFLKIRVSLELADELDISRVQDRMPRIVDNFQVYLRELRVEDLKGSAGMYRLREELLMRVTAAAAPAIVNDVLFKEILVQ